MVGSRDNPIGTYAGSNKARRLQRVGGKEVLDWPPPSFPHYYAALGVVAHYLTIGRRLRA